MDEKTKLRYFLFNRFSQYSYRILKKINQLIYLNPISLNRNEGYTPFFIVGSGRSGNTLLRRVLNSHDGIVIPPESYVLGRVIRLHELHKSMHWNDYVNLILSTIEYHHQFYTFEVDSLSELALELKETEDQDKSLAYIINNFYTFYARKKSLDIVRWGDKTPLNAMYVYRIKDLFPKAQFVHIIRDGADVVNSYINAGIYSEHIMAALRWKKSVQFLRKFGQRYPSSYLEIRYEELVREPEEIVKKVCEFLEITFEPEMLLSSAKEISDMGDVEYLDHHNNVYNKINTASIGKGRKALSVDAITTIKGELNSLLTELGYQSI